MKLINNNSFTLRQIFSYYFFTVNIIKQTVGIRLKSITNIQKITKTMKMISAAKFAQASKAIVPARAYGEGAVGMFRWFCKN